MERAVLRFDPRLTVADVAAELRCQGRKVRDLCKAGRLAYEQDGDRAPIFIRRSALDTYLSSITRKPCPVATTAPALSSTTVASGKSAGTTPDHAAVLRGQRIAAKLNLSSRAFSRAAGTSRPRASRSPSPT